MCCLALTTDCRLYSSHCRQCCLGHVPAEWDACCCRCSVELAEGSTRQLRRRSCIPNKLAAWTRDTELCHCTCWKGNDMLGVITPTGHDTVHYLTCWSTTQHVSEVHRWTCMPLDMWRCSQGLCRWTRWNLTWWNATRYCCQCCMLTTGRDACVGGLAVRDSTLCRSSVWRCFLPTPWRHP